MKRLLFALLFISGVSFAGTLTTRMGIDKIADGTSNWGIPIRANYDIIDSSVAILASTQTFTAPQVFQSTVTFSTFTVSQVFISTPAYTGTEKLVVNGAAKFFGSNGGTVSVCGSNGTICGQFTAGGAPAYITLPNTLGTNNVTLKNDGATQPVLQLVGSTTGGASSIDGSNNPAVFSADRLMVGPTFGDRIGNIINPSGDRSAFEESIYIGTHTVSGTPRFAVVGDTAMAYSVLIGTSPTLSSTNYQVGISTSGGVVFTQKTLAQLATMKPISVGETYACSNCVTDAVCVGTQTATVSWARISAKGTICQ